MGKAERHWVPEPMKREGRFTCLTYHVIGDDGGQYVISEDRLRNQLDFLAREGFVMDGFEQLEHRLRTKTVFPAKCALLTVDDGHESSRCGRPRSWTNTGLRLLSS